MRVTSVADIGIIVREKRKKTGMTQKEAAGIIGVGVRFLSELENGKPTLEIDKVLRVLVFLGIDLEASDR
ncbi:MAG: helix-turn-helix transcriptional regulator [Bullifex sp.]